MKTLSKRPEGRPTKLNDDMVVKLESILKIGGTIEEACSYALINKTSYYRWIEQDESFATRMEAAKHYADIAAKNIVVSAITKDKDLGTAKWWLEKREFSPNIQNNQFTQVNIGGDMGVKFEQDVNT